MTVGSLESASAIGQDWVGTLRARPLDSTQAGLEQRASRVQDTVEISARGQAASAKQVAADAPDVQQFKKREDEVRAHERAHMSAGGSAVKGGASYTYATGPDGKRYIADGEVSVVLAAVKEPRKAVESAELVQRAALAPADPSPQDRAVAAQAAQAIAQARQELSGADEATAIDGAGSMALEASEIRRNPLSAYSTPAQISTRSWLA